MNNMFKQCISDMFQPQADIINNRLNPENCGPQNSDGKFKCIYFDIDEFCELLDKSTDFLYKTKKLFSEEIKFLDVGCGAGQKVYVAGRQGLDSFGLEFHKEFVEEARRLLHLYTYRMNTWGLNKENQKYEQNSISKWEEKIINGDATTYDGYGNYNIIYFYRPIADTDGQILLEEKVAKTAKVGAVVLAVYNPPVFSKTPVQKDYQKIVHSNFLTNLGWERIDNCMWHRKSLGA